MLQRSATETANEVASMTDSMAVMQRRWTIALLIAVAGGLWLRVVEFGAHRSFSIDEAALARNVIGRSWRQLVEPLDFAQVAPPLFLWLQKASLALPVDRDNALRIVPLVAGCSTLYLGWAAGRRLFREWLSALAFVGLLALSTPMIAYASTAKPYSSDVTASMLVMAATLAAGESTSVRRATLLGTASALSVLLSFTAVFALVAAALASVARLLEIRSRRARTAPTIYAGMCGAGALAGVALGRQLISSADSAYMKWYWSSGFVPFADGTGPSLRWLWLQATGFFSQTLQYRLATVWLLCLLAGMAWLARKRRYADLLLLVTPLALVFGGSLFHVYPFTTGRIGLFLIPSALALVVAGAAAIGGLLPKRVRSLQVIPLLVLLGVGLHAATRSDLPRDPGRHPLRAFLEQVAREWKPGDALFVHYNEAQPFLYYESTFRFPRADVLVGTCSRGSGRRYLRDASAFAGRPRVWMAMSHEDDTDGNLIRRYLDAIGSRTAPQRDDARQGFGYLYDLTRPSTAGVSPESFPLPEALSADAPFPYSCYGVFSPWLDTDVE